MGFCLALRLNSFTPNITDLLTFTKGIYILSTTDSNSEAYFFV
jgi:hypothetical protein